MLSKFFEFGFEFFDNIFYFLQLTLFQTFNLV